MEILELKSKITKRKTLLEKFNGRLELKEKKIQQTWRETKQLSILWNRKKDEEKRVVTETLPVGQTKQATKHVRKRIKRKRGRNNIFGEKV